MSALNTVSVLDNGYLCICAFDITFKAKNNVFGTYCHQNANPL